MIPRAQSGSSVICQCMQKQCITIAIKNEYFSQPIEIYDRFVHNIRTHPNTRGICRYGMWAVVDRRNLFIIQREDTTMKRWIAGLKFSWFRVFQEDDDGLANSRQSLFLGNLFSIISTNITAGTFYTALLIVLFRGHPESLRNEYIGRIAMLQTGAGFLQMVAPYIIERLKTRKKYVLSLRWLYHGLNIFGLAFIPILPIDIYTRANLFMVVAALMSASTALYTPAMSAWHIHPLSEYCRSDYYALYNMASNVLSLFVSLLSSVMMDFFTKSEKEYTAVILMRGIALFIVALEFNAFRKIKEPIYLEGEKRLVFWDILTAPFRHPRYLINILIGGIWTGSAATVGSYFVVYLVTDAKFSYTMVSLCGAVSLPIGLIAAPIWSRFIQKYGWLRPMAVSFFLYALQFFFNVLVTEETKWMYAAGVIFYMAVSSGSIIGLSNLPYMNAPKEGLSSCLAFYNTFGALMGFFGAWAGKVFMQKTAGKFIHIFGLTLKNASYIYLLPVTGTLLVALLLWAVYRMDEKQKYRR